MMKRDLYSDASLLKRLLVEDLSEDDKQKILRLLEERGLSDVYKEVKESSYVKDRFSDYEKYSAKEAYQLFLKRQNEYCLGWQLLFCLACFGEAIGCFLMIRL